VSCGLLHGGKVVLFKMHGVNCRVASVETSLWLCVAKLLTILNKSKGRAEKMIFLVHKRDFLCSATLFFDV
jgi:hypothetical protein